MTQILYGKQVVRQVLRENRSVKKLYLSSPSEELETLAKKAGVPVVFTDRKKLNLIRVLRLKYSRIRQYPWMS